MSLHSTTRVPVNYEYVALVGKAVYVFAYYEWNIIWIIEFLKIGFVDEYSRGNPMTSGAVQKSFRTVIENPATSFAKISKQELTDCCNQFDALIIKRNSLIHAHPCTDSSGEQILTYQTKLSKPLPDMKWPPAEIERIISEFDVAAFNAGEILDKLRK